MKAVIDASVAVKWVVEETGHREALELIGPGVESLAPRFALIECANVLWKKASRNELNAAQARDGLDFIERGYTSLIPDEAVLSEALALAVELSHPVYDCLYLACADRHGAALITEDRRFLNKLIGTRFAAKVRRFESAS